MLFEPPIQIPTPVRVVPAAHPTRLQEHDDSRVSPPPTSRSEPVDEIRSILFHKTALRSHIMLGQSRDWSGYTVCCEDGKEEAIGDESPCDDGAMDDDEMTAVALEGAVYQPPTFSFDLPHYEPSISPGPPGRCTNPIVQNKGFLSDFGGALGARVTPKSAMDVQGAELGLLSLSPPRQPGRYRF